MMLLKLQTHEQKSCQENIIQLEFDVQKCNFLADYQPKNANEEPHHVEMQTPSNDMYNDVDNVEQFESGTTLDSWNIQSKSNTNSKH